MTPKNFLDASRTRKGCNVLESCIFLSATWKYDANQKTRIHFIPPRIDNTANNFGKGRKKKERYERTAEFASEDSYQDRAEFLRDRKEPAKVFSKFRTLRTIHVMK